MNSLVGFKPFLDNVYFAHVYHEFVTVSSFCRKNLGVKSEFVASKFYYVSYIICTCIFSYLLIIIIILLI